MVYSGRVFLPHIIYAFCKLQHKTHKICVSHETHQDIAWWHRFLETFNGKSLLLHKNPITPVYTDACTSGAGGLWDGDWFHCCWDIDLTVLRLVFMLNPCTNLPNCPAFMYILESKTHILSYATFLQMLKSCLSQIGLDPSKYSGHSFRRGGASFALECGLPPDLIKSQGDWKSDAYQSYLDPSLSFRVQVAERLGSEMLRRFPTPT